MGVCRGMQGIAGEGREGQGCVGECMKCMREQERAGVCSGGQVWAREGRVDSQWVAWGG